MRYRNRSFDDLKTCTKSREGLEKLEKAYMVSKRLFKNKQSVLQHQLNTAFIIAKLNLDIDTITAALLHECVYELPKSEEEIAKLFGGEITSIVKEIAKLKHVKKSNANLLDYKALAKVILGVAQDIRSLIIELASQLDKMRFIKKRSQNEQTMLAKLAMNVYAPICHKLGLYEIEWELQDLAFKKLNYSEYEKIKAFVNEKRQERERKVERAKKEIAGLLEKYGLQVFMQARAKNFYSIYKKMREQNKDFNSIYDLLGVRVICDSVEDCYRALSIIHMHYAPIGKFYDYIAKPKENNYRSIHTVVDWHGEFLEVQIRTWEMHRDAEEGLAAHWRYKNVEHDKYFDKKLSWAKQLVELQRTIKKKDFMKSLRLSFGQREIFVLTPKKEVIMLPENSTALDFAYAIHTDIGNRCKAVFVNGRQRPLDHTLESGDTVEIIVDKEKRVKRDWLRFVKTSKAKAKIRKELGLKATHIKEKKEKVSEKKKKVVIAKCCMPLPGDAVIGYKTTKRKITIHRADCSYLSGLPKDRKISIDESLWKQKQYTARIRVKAFERAGLLIDLLKTLEKLGATINSSEARSESENITKCLFDVNVKSFAHVERIRKELLKLPGVFEVGRD